MFLWPLLPAYSNTVYEGDEKNKPEYNFVADMNTGNSYNYSPLAPIPAPRNVSLSTRGIVFIIAPTYSMIHNGDIYGDASWNAKGGFGFNVEVDFFSKITRNGLLKFGVGIGYSQYKTDLSAASVYHEIPNSTDIDNYNYTKIVEIDQLSEKLKLGYLDIPIYLEIGNSNVDQVGFYGRIGFKVSFPVSSKLEGSGTFSSQGYYEDCPVLLYGIPELGFYTDKPIHSEEQDIKLKPVVFSALLAGGVTFPLSNVLVLKLGVNINFGLTEISDSKATENDFEANGNYSKILNSPSSTTLRSYGLEVGLIYTLRLD